MSNKVKKNKPYNKHNGQDFSDRLNSLLQTKAKDGKEYSMTTLGEKIGVTRQAISQWKNNVTMPTVPALIDIANLYDVTTDYLVGRTNVQNTDEGLILRLKEISCLEIVDKLLVEYRNQFLHLLKQIEAATKYSGKVSAKTTFSKKGSAINSGVDEIIDTIELSYDEMIRTKAKSTLDNLIEEISDNEKKNVSNGRYTKDEIDDFLSRPRKQVGNGIVYTHKADGTVEKAINPAKDKKDND